MRKPRGSKEVPFNLPFNDGSAAAAFEVLHKGLLKFNRNLSEEVMTDVASYCKHVIFKKNAVLLNYGEVCNQVYFSIRGLVTSLEKDDEDEDEEYNSWFMSNGDVIIAIDSFFNREPSEERLVALAETECIVLHVDDLDMLRDKHPSFHKTETYLLRHYYMGAFKRTKWIRKSAKSKFRLFKEQYPDLISQVSRKAIASFLGISRKRLNEIMAESLSK